MIWGTRFDCCYIDDAGTHFERLDEDDWGETETDDGGRILKDFKLSNDDCGCDYEMVCKTADYFSKKKIISEIVIKFRMEDPEKKYHIPIIISPNGYSIWWSQ